MKKDIFNIKKSLFFAINSKRQRQTKKSHTSANKKEIGEKIAHANFFCIANLKNSMHFKFKADCRLSGCIHMHFKLFSLLHYNSEVSQ